MLSVIPIITIQCNNKTTSTLNQDIKISNIAEQEVKVEEPPLQKKEVNIGRLQQHQNGYSIGKNTEWTKLRDLLDDNDIIEISWIWDCGHYGDMPMKLIYNKPKKSLSRVFTQTNVKEHYNGVSIESLKTFLAKNEKDIYAIEKYSKDAQYDFNNREMHNAKAGIKPKQESDGTVKIVADFIKNNTQNAKILGWSKVVAYSDYWAVRCEWKFNDVTGESITNNVWFYIQNSKVVAIKDVLGNIVNL